MINDAVIGRLDFTYDPRKREWVKKDNAKKRKEPETATGAAQETATAAEAGTSTAAETGTSSAATVLAPREMTNGELGAMILRRFTVIDHTLARMDANINARLGKMDAKIENLEAEIWEIKERPPLEDEEDDIDSDEMTP